MKTELSHFNFMPAGHGHYNVSYTSPATGKKWSKVISDMHIIDLTKNAEEPKRKDLDWLKSIIKR